MIIGYHMLMIIAIILYWLVVLTILETYELMVVWYRALWIQVPSERTCLVIWCSGWWCNNHFEKYEFVSQDDYSK